MRTSALFSSTFFFVFSLLATTSHALEISIPLPAATPTSTPTPSATPVVTESPSPVSTPAAESTPTAETSPTPEPTAEPLPRLTLVALINTLLGETPDLLGLTLEDYETLAEDGMNLSNPNIELHDPDGTGAGIRFSGAKITGTEEKITYIAFNANDETLTYVFNDGYSIDVPPLGVGLALLNNNEALTLDDFGPVFTLGTGNIVIRYPVEALDSLSLLSEMTYSISEQGVTIAGEEISVIGVTAITGTEANEVFDFSGTTETIAISHIDGGEGSDSLMASNTTNTWTISDTNSLTTPYFDLVFLNMEELIGGSQQDSFDLNQSFDGILDGAEGDDNYNINATNIDITIHDSGSNGADFLISYHSDASIWAISAEGQGTVTNDDNTSQIEFSGTQNLIGGDGQDTFEIDVNESISSINGGAGNDIIDITDNTYSNCSSSSSTTSASTVSSDTNQTQPEDPAICNYSLPDSWSIDSSSDLNVVYLTLDDSTIFLENEIALSVPEEEEENTKNSGGGSTPYGFFFLVIMAGFFKKSRKSVEV